MTTHLNDEHPDAAGLQAFLDAGLSSGERRRVEEHLRSCRSCAVRVDVWSALFDELDSLPRLVPHEGFQARVMSGLRVPEPRPLAARLRRLIGRLVPGGGSSRHLGADRLQELAEGLLPEPAAARTRAHLDECRVCSREFAGWRALTAGLDRLGHLSPSPGFPDEVMATWRLERGLASLEHLEPSGDFADRVMAGVRIPAGAAVAAHAPAASGRWDRLLAAARSLVPQTRRAWATVSGMAVAPAATFSLVLWAVFSHPALTPRALASFTWWKATDLMAAGWTTISTLALDSAGLFQAYQALGTLLASPGMLAAAALVLAMGSGVSSWVLYRNLIPTHRVDGRYVHVHG